MEYLLYNRSRWGEPAEGGPVALSKWRAIRLVSGRCRAALHNTIIRAVVYYIHVTVDIQARTANVDFPPGDELTSGVGKMAGPDISRSMSTDTYYLIFILTYLSNCYETQSRQIGGKDEDPDNTTLCIPWTKWTIKISYRLVCYLWLEIIIFWITNMLRVKTFLLLKKV